MTTFSQGAVLTAAQLTAVSNNADKGAAVAAGSITAPILIVAPNNGATKMQVNATGLGFFAATPVAQPAGAAQAAMVDSTGGTPSGTNTLAAITAGAAYTQADLTAIKNAIATLAAGQNAIRLALVNLGLAKGSA